MGKSTLLNGMVREKLAIITKKPETTRDVIKGISTGKDHQIVFLDTPGLHRPRNLLGKILLHRAQSSVMEADMVLFVTEKKGFLNQEDQNIIKLLKDTRKKDRKVFLVINKVDRQKDKNTLLPMIEQASKTFDFDHIIPLCALDRKDLEKLTGIIIDNLQEGPLFYPEGQQTDREDDFMIREIIREKILMATHQEVPHSVAVKLENISEDEKGKLNISAGIYVERNSQKAIIVGAGGKMIKHVGTKSRKDIEKLLKRKIYLDLWVKVDSKWKKDPASLKKFGYNN